MKKKRYTHLPSLDILALAPNAWEGPWMNRQQLLSRLGQQHSILYSNGLWTVWDRVQPAWKQSPLVGQFRAQDQVLVDHAPRFLLRWPRFPSLDRVAIHLAARRWARVSTAGEGSPRVAYLFHPQFYPYVESIRPDYVIYHAYDLLSLTPEWNEALEKQQRQLLERADLIVASSTVIAQELASVSGKAVETLPNGADYQTFCDAATEDVPEPADLANIPHPRIGYVGNLNLKVDFPLVAQLAESHPDWHFVFVGGQGKLDEPTQGGVNVCSGLLNVHFLGAKDYRQIAHYAANMDVNLMCYRVEGDVWTRGIYPLKLHEYLATGKPVVSADIPSVMPFTSVVAVARGSHQWAQMIESALQGQAVGSTAERRAVAKENSWDARAQRLNDCLAAMVNGIAE